MGGTVARLMIAVGMVATAVIGWPSAAAAQAGGPFVVTIDKPCLLPGETQTITVLPGWEAMAIVVTYPNGTPQTLTPVRSGDQKVVSWTIGAGAAAGTATVVVSAWIGPADPQGEGQSGIASAIGTFVIGTAGQPCIGPTYPHLSGVFAGAPEVPTVKKLCDPGVTGTATFSISLNVPDGVAHFNLPASMDVTAACNGAAVPLPILSAGVVATLHEVRLPSGAASAADTTFPVSLTGFSEAAQQVTIRNAKAASTTRPTPTPTRRPATRVLPTTGGGRSGPSGDPWPVFVAAGALFAAAATILRRGRQPKA